MTLKQSLKKCAEWFIGSLFTLGVGMLLLYKTDAIASKKEARLELERKANIEDVKEWDAAVVEKMETADETLAKEIEDLKIDITKDIEDLKIDIAKEFDDFNKSQDQLHDIQNSKVDGYHNTVIEMFKLQNQGK
jgi:hypothetical protein